MLLLLNRITTLVLMQMGANSGQEKLHPSWLAKKALAEKATSMAKPQGTKMVFTDDA